MRAFKAPALQTQLIDNFLFGNIYNHRKHSTVQSEPYFLYPLYSDSKIKTQYFDSFLLYNNIFCTHYKSTDPQARRLCTILPCPAFGFAFPVGPDRIARDFQAQTVSRRDRTTKIYKDYRRSLWYIVFNSFAILPFVRGQIRTVLSPWAGDRAVALYRDIFTILSSGILSPPQNIICRVASSINRTFPETVAYLPPLFLLSGTK